MVVEILEDKLDTEYMDFATQMALDLDSSDVKICSSESEAECSNTEEPDQKDAAAGKDKSALSVPEHWVPMLEDQVCGCLMIS